MDGMNYYILAFLAIFLFGIIEWALKVTWHPGYFTTGIPIYQKRAFLHHNANVASAFDYIQRAMNPSIFYNSLEFKEIRSNVFAFREKPIEFRIISMKNGESMRRVIFYYPESGEVEIKGFLNWIYLPVWGFFLIWLLAGLIVNFTLATFLGAVSIGVLIFAFSIVPSIIIEVKANDKVLYYLKVYFHSQITSRR